MMKLFIATLLTCALGFPLKDLAGMEEDASLGMDQKKTRQHAAKPKPISLAEIVTMIEAGDITVEKAEQLHALLDTMVENNNQQQITCFAEVADLEVQKVHHVNGMVIMTKFKDTVGDNFCDDGNDVSSLGDSEIDQFIKMKTDQWAVSQGFIDENCQTLQTEQDSLNQIKDMVNQFTAGQTGGKGGFPGP